MTNEPVDTTSKERRCQAYQTTLLPHHNAPWLTVITGKLRYRFASITAIFFPLTDIQRIVRAASPLNMNVGGVVPKLRMISVMQGQQY